MHLSEKKLFEYHHRNLKWITNKNKIVVLPEVIHLFMFIIHVYTIKCFAVDITFVWNVTK